MSKQTHWQRNFLIQNKSKTFGTMGNFTKYDALIGELEPYSPSPATIKKSLLDAGIGDFEADYTASDKRDIAKAAIAVLKRLIVLSSDSMGKSSQGYKTDELEKRIKALAEENGLEAEDFLELPTVEGGSHLW